MWQVVGTGEDAGEAVMQAQGAIGRSEARFEELLFDVIRRGASDDFPLQLGRGLAPPEEIAKVFHRTWGVLEEEMELEVDSDQALKRMADLVVYDVPDGTRSTLSVTASIDIGQDAGLFCLAFLHTLQSLGARRAVVMTHTSYNRLRGSESTHRILKILSDGTKPMAAYARAKGVNVHLLGIGENYELRNQLLQVFPPHQPGNFDAFFLVDYSEDYFLGQGREHLDELPDIDVSIRHTKMGLGGGWIPGKMLKSAFLYCQNGSLFSNWRYDEITVLATLSLAAKLFHQGEGLTKVYGDVDEVKRRHQMRELQLFHKSIELSPKPRKLFLVGSPVGVYRVTC